MSHRISLIPLPSLQLDERNPRLKPSHRPRSQLEILRELALSDEYADKIFALAKDIADFGLDPTSLICVYKRTAESKQYVVVEGNRRVTALKVLLNPEVISGLTTPSRSKELRKLSESPLVPKLVNCIIFDDIHTAEHWIELKHTGQHGGAGTVPWGTVEALRYSHRDKTKPIELQLLDFANVSFSGLDIGKVKITNLERLVSDPDVREALGIYPLKGVVYVDREVLGFAEILRLLLVEMSKDGFTVNSIKTKLDRQNFITKFLSLNNNEVMKFERSHGSRYAINEMISPISKKLPQKSGRSVIRNSLYKSALTAIYTDQRYSHRTKTIAKELKDFAFSKSPIGAIYLMQAFLEDFIIEAFSKSDNPNTKANLKSKLKILLNNNKVTQETDVIESIELILSSPLVSKKATENILNMNRQELNDYMADLLNAFHVMIVRLHKIGKSLSV